MQKARASIVFPVELADGRDGWDESAGLRLRHVKQGRNARGAGMERERRMKEKSFLDSESPTWATYAKLN